MKGNRGFLLARMYQIINHTNTHTHTIVLLPTEMHTHYYCVTPSVLKSEYVALIQAPYFAKRSRLLLDFYAMSRFGTRLNSLLHINAVYKKM